MNHKKKVSIIIPCYNVSKWLPQCFLSLVGQTIGIENLELIFVDDASTDDGKTWDLLQEMERGFSESIVLIHLEENMRQGGARNVGMQYACGEYLAFVDADDWVDKTLFETVCQVAEDSRADIVQFDHVIYVDGVGEFPNTRQGVMRPVCLELTSEEARKSFLVEEWLSLGCSNKIYRRSMVQEAGIGYAEHVVNEESLFTYPLFFYAKRVCILPNVLYYYRKNPQGTMHIDLAKTDSLYQLATVQRQVWEFMKATDFFESYYSEIEFYFVRNFLYLPLLLAHRRKIEMPLDLYHEISAYMKKECPEYEKNPYWELVPVQKEVLESMRGAMTQERLNSVVERI